jgi:hypothetical protein
VQLADNTSPRRRTVNAKTTLGRAGVPAADDSARAVGDRVVITCRRIPSEALEVQIGTVKAATK